MVVHEVNIESVAVDKPENDSPIRAHGDRLKIRKVAFQRMQPERRVIEIGNFSAVCISAKICLILRTCSGLTPRGLSSSKKLL
jgi:hypothetical protein